VAAGGGSHYLVLVMVSINDSTSSLMPSSRTQPHTDRDEAARAPPLDDCDRDGWYLLGLIREVKENRYPALMIPLRLSCFLSLPVGAQTWSGNRVGIRALRLEASLTSQEGAKEK
jgi:hypothetical protein